MIRLYNFVQTLVVSGAAAHHGGGCPKESMYDVVVGHLTDSPFLFIKHPHGIGQHIGNLVYKINTMLGFQVPHTDPTQICMHGHPTEVFLSNPVKLFGVFDMRITKWVLMMWLAAFVCMLVFIPLSRAISKSKLGSKSRWVNFWESLVGFVHDEIVEPNFDHKYIKKAMPYFSSVFFFILFCNLIGLVPGAATATGNLAVTGGLAVFTLVGMFVIGTLRQGPLWVIKGIVPHGVPIFLFPMLWVIELFGLFIKPFALTVRLFANMAAGHVVIIIFIYLVMMFQIVWVGVGSVAGSLIIYLLEILVAFIQAYIFAALSAMFIGSCMHAH